MAARSAWIIDLGQHMLQTVTKLMKERRHFIKGHEAGFIFNGRALVANEVGNRQAGAAFPFKRKLGATYANIHPGATAFIGGAAIGIEIEKGDRLSRFIGHLKITHIGMPDRGFPIGRGNGYSQNSPS